MIIDRLSTICDALSCRGNEITILGLVSAGLKRPLHPLYLRRALSRLICHFSVVIQRPRTIQESAHRRNVCLSRRKLLRLGHRRHIGLAGQSELAFCTLPKRHHVSFILGQHNCMVSTESHVANGMFFQRWVELCDQLGDKIVFDELALPETLPCVSGTATVRRPQPSCCHLSDPHT